jgi:hypothetical protein
MSADPASFCGTPHVDVDNLCAAIDAGTCRERQLPGLGSRDLHRDRLGVEIEIEPVAGFGGLPQARVGRSHLGGGHAGTEVPAELAERFVRDAGHGRENERAVEFVGSDCQGGTVHAGIVSRLVVAAGALLEARPGSDREPGREPT